MRLRFAPGEIGPQNSGVIVVREDQVRLAVAVDVCHPAAFGVVTIGNKMPLPLRMLGSWVLPPEHAVGHPARSHHIGPAVVIHVDRPLAAVGDEFATDARLAILVALPFSAVWAGILIPIRTAEKIGPPIAVHVERGDAFCMIGAETMDEEGSLRNAAGTGAGSRLALSLRQRWVRRLNLGLRRGRGLRLDDCNASQHRQQQQSSRPANSVSFHLRIFLSSAILFAAGWAAQGRSPG